LLTSFLNSELMIKAVFIICEITSERSIQGNSLLLNQGENFCFVKSMLNESKESLKCLFIFKEK